MEKCKLYGKNVLMCSEQFKWVYLQINLYGMQTNVSINTIY